MRHPHVGYLVHRPRPRESLKSGQSVESSTRVNPTQVMQPNKQSGHYSASARPPPVMALFAGFPMTPWTFVVTSTDPARVRALGDGPVREPFAARREAYPEAGLPHLVRHAVVGVVGAFGAMAKVLGDTGFDAVVQLGVLMLAFDLT